jgi:hypothetical protein
VSLQKLIQTQNPANTQKTIKITIIKQIILKIISILFPKFAFLNCLPLSISFLIREIKSSIKRNSPKKIRNVINRTAK